MPHVEADNFDALAFHWLASASEKLPMPRLGLDLTASVSPWLICLMGDEWCG